jgi:hypothetical protein
MVLLVGMGVPERQMQLLVLLYHMPVAAELVVKGGKHPEPEDRASAERVQTPVPEEMQPQTPGLVEAVGGHHQMEVMEVTELSSSGILHR